MLDQCTFGRRNARGTRKKDLLDLVAPARSFVFAIDRLPLPEHGVQINAHKLCAERRIERWFVNQRHLNTTTARSRVGINERYGPGKRKAQNDWLFLADGQTALEDQSDRMIIGLK